MDTGAFTAFKTYLGTSTECKSCHQDIHDSPSESFKQCYRCHDTSSWDKRPQSNFNHTRDTKFQFVTGAHADLKCFQCHTQKKMGSDEWRLRKLP